jgi:hypothetical protein
MERELLAPVDTSELVTICQSPVSPDQTGLEVKLPSAKLSSTVNEQAGGGANKGGFSVELLFAAQIVKGKPRATHRARKSLFMTSLLKFRNQKLGELRRNVDLPE